MAHIKKSDRVIVMRGKDRGKQGIVIEVFPKKGKVKVEGAAIVTRHVKAKKQGEKSGIVKVEGLIDLSNVMLLDPASGKPSRVGYKVLENGKKVRVYKRSGEII